ncbi:MAG TPA: protein kinase [Candidatus Eremiobacteraeota bacterium]|nr:MAG: Serine/threonine-protein kinase C [bacterium ADurb.Bin363]HPZ10228.1 protein kinase [Candidatus Eremiobacteraeota bacterium]
MDISCPNCGGVDYDNNFVCQGCGFFINQLPPGTLLINRYEIIKAIKAGGMGAIYLALDIFNEQNCAVKQMFLYEEEQKINDYITRRFLSEARLLVELNHPFIPRVLDYFNQSTYNYYMVMDYIEGCDLYTYVMDRLKGLPELLVLKWAVQICDILDYLHSRPQPIIHRDINPANLILRNKDQHLMLVDFGFARPVNPDKHMTAGIGTETYASPEQYNGYGEPRSDIYSLGATMHFLLTLQESKKYKFCPVRKVRPDVSKKTEWIVEKAVEFLPQDRFSSAKEMKQAITG